MPEVSIDLPTHLIDVPAGHNNKYRYYYIPVHNVSDPYKYSVQQVLGCSDSHDLPSNQIPPGGAKEIIDHRLQHCHVIDWQFHYDGQSGWVCFASEKDFEMALGLFSHDIHASFVRWYSV